MSQVKINLKAVTNNIQSHPEFLKNLAAFQAQFAKPGFIESVCIHEAGHHFYYVKAGATAFKFNGPRVVPNSERGVLEFLSADVQAVEWDDSFRNKTDEEKVLAMALVVVAGGASARILANVADVGDEGDRQRFEYICKVAKLSEKWESLWKNADETVTAELQDSAIQTKIKETAEDLKSLLFEFQ